jgi:hypothetical protein
VSALDTKIDDLYHLPLGEFTAARNALAKSLAGDEAKRVKALEKPTVVPWAVNQVYWRARSTYDRLMKSGEKLRAAQIAALEGRAADVRAATEAHRRAITDAVAEAERLSAASGAKPGVDALARTFESLSLATSAPQAPGRLTDALQPAGFEALLGITPSDVRSTKSEARSGRLELAKPNVERRTPKDERRTKAAALAAERESARLAAERQKYDAAVKAAEAELARVQRAEQNARETWERAHDDLLAARQALSDLRRSRFKSPGGD